MLKEGSLLGNYRLLRPLGMGSYASVWEAIHIIVDVHVALKVITRSSLDTPEKELRFQREISLLRKTHHPFIIRFYEFFQDENYNYIVMEYAGHGTLLEFTNKNGCLSESLARRYFCQLLSALEYLHETQHIAHRDVKTENILLDKYDNVKLIDFGLSTTFSSKQGGELKTLCGSPAYAAPEMLKGKSYTKQADVWSAGVLLYAMVLGRLPFQGEHLHEYIKNITSDDIKVPSILSPQLQDLIYKMLTPDPYKRITIAKIKEHPWFSLTNYTINSYDLANDSQCIDKEIIIKIHSAGIDTSNLASDIFSGEYNEITAMYRMIKRQKFIDEFEGERKKPNLESSSQGRTVEFNEIDIGQNPPSPTRKVLHVPINVQAAARRLSRPLAVRPGTYMRKTNQSPKPRVGPFVITK